jgi:hypothetical protein
MKKKLLLISMFSLLSTTIQADYIIQIEKNHYNKNITILEAGNEEESVILPSPDTNNVLNQLEITDSSHILGAGWYLFSEGNQSNFSNLAVFSTLQNSNNIKFTIYNSDDLYLTFNRSLSTRDGSNIDGLPYWLTSSATIINNNGINIGDYVHHSDHSSTSGIIFSSSTTAPWCSIIHGRYNGGCINANVGLGNWKVYVK